jgi:EAL domain-containing protein (putative c-di-GMP-specific phosphodiesterase class I)
MAVNVSVQQLRDTAFPATLRRLIDRYQVSPAALDLEVTEAAIIDAESQSVVEAIAAMGIGLSLDDFGTGHTSLGNLRLYPVRAVKIDRSFVEEIASDASAGALAGTIIMMAHTLGKQVVAEGVESLEQLDFLRERGCDVAQGYYLARPLPAAAMTDLLMRPGSNDEEDDQHAVSA